MEQQTEFQVLDMVQMDLNSWEQVQMKQYLQLEYILVTTFPMKRETDTA